MKSTGIQHEIDRYTQIQKILAPGGKPLYVGTFLHRAAQLYGERCALIFKEQCYTYAQLSRWANQVLSVS